MRKTQFAAAVLFLSPVLALAQPAEKVDLNMIHRIKEEALGRNSKVMDHMFYLTDVNGPRLTDSKGYRAAGEWAVKRLKEYGLSNVHLEKRGPCGKAWKVGNHSGHTNPQEEPTVSAEPVAWTPGHNGGDRRKPKLGAAQKQEDFDKLKGKPPGKIVMNPQKRHLAMVANPLGTRY